MSWDTRNAAAVKALADANSTGGLVGLKDVTGQSVARQDIDDYLLGDPEGFNLFLLALQRIQDPKANNNLLSFYQLAGIHGLPLSVWNAKDFPGKVSGAGYCNHASPKFPTWHRPYLALLEQSLYSAMIEIIKDSPAAEQPKQLEAAQRFRLPYWDYWKPRGGTTVFPGIKNNGTTEFKYDFRLPDIFVAPIVMVRVGGKLIPIDNPLASYTVPKPKNPSAWPGVSNGFTTSRQPSAAFPVTVLNTSVNGRRENLNTTYLGLLQDDAYQYYVDVATTQMVERSGDANFVKTFAGAGNVRGFGSLEAIHNSYHWGIGGTRGTMTDPGLAAFDPVFWLHHCQIDRLMAIWQAAHPDAWFAGTKGTELADEGLLPFTKARKDVTSNLVQKVKDLGYTYPDLSDNPKDVTAKYVAQYQWVSQKRLSAPAGTKPTFAFKTGQPFQYDAATLKKIREIAAKTGALAEALDIEKPDAVARNPTILAPTTFSRSLAQTPITAHRIIENAIPKEALPPDEIKEDEVERTWYIDNLYPRLTLNSTFTIYFFLGDVVDAAVVSYSTQPTLGGITHNFAAPVEYCDNCGQQEQSGTIVTSTVVITPILKDYVSIGRLPDLSPESVTPFLVKHLKWRVVTFDGTRIDPRLVQGLTLGVSTKVESPDGHVFYQEYNRVIADILGNAS